MMKEEDCPKFEDLLHGWSKNISRSEYVSYLYDGRIMIIVSMRLKGEESGIGTPFCTCGNMKQAT